MSLAAARGGTHLQLHLALAETAITAVPYIAGIQTGWGQVLDRLAELLGASQSSSRASITKDPSS